MSTGIYKFAILVAITTFISCMMGGITMTTSLIRSVIVLLGTLLIFSVFLQLLRWGLIKSVLLQKKAKAGQVDDE